MKQLSHFSGIGLSFAYWILISLWNTMPIEMEWGFCVLLLASLGIPHGAADHLVAKQLSSGSGKPFNFFVFIVKYLSVMLIYAMLWYVSPLISFIIFIGISVFHFGDLETSVKSKTEVKGLKYSWEILISLMLGIGILGFILSVHAQEVQLILQSFDLGHSIPIDYLPPAFYLVCIFIGYQKTHASYFINTGITLLIGIYLPILPAFMCYFAGCHAVYSLRILARSMNLSLKKLYLQLLPFTFLAFALGIGYILIINPSKWLAHSFIFLSILTLPHFFLMHKIAIRKP